MRPPFLYRLLALLPGLLLSLTLLAGCGENSTSTAVALRPESSPTTVSIVSNTSTATSAPAIASPTNPAPPAPTQTSLPLATATNPVPTSTPVPPTATPLPATPGNMEGNLPSEGQPQRPPTVSELPRVNGILKIPVLNSNRPSAQPEPVIKANYGPNNTPKVGIQIGHYQIEQLPDENASLRGQTGGSGGGVREVDFNQDIARRVGALLVAKGITVDILPASVPPAYTADAFVAIHADAASSGGPSGFKLARSRFSAIPKTDDALVNTLYETYARATGMGTDSGITRNMTGYYAFNSRNRYNAVSKITPSAIIETGFLTSAADRAVLLGRPDAVAQGIADGILTFLQNRPPLDAREKAQREVPSIEAALENTPIYNENGGIIAYVTKGQRFDYVEERNGNYQIFVPILRQPGILHKSDTNRTVSPR